MRQVSKWASLPTARELVCVVLPSPSLWGSQSWSGVVTHPHGRNAVPLCLPFSEQTCLPADLYFST